MLFRRDYINITIFGIPQIVTSVIDRPGIPPPGFTAYFICLRNIILNGITGRTLCDICPASAIWAKACIFRNFLRTIRAFHNNLSPSALMRLLYILTINMKRADYPVDFRFMTRFSFFYTISTGFVSLLLVLW